MGESILFPWSWSVCFFDPHLPVIFLFRTGHLVCVLFKMPLWPNLSINMWHLMSAGLQGSHYGQWIWEWQRILGLRYLITSGFTFSLPTRWATHLPSNYIAGLFPNSVFRGPFDPWHACMYFVMPHQGSLVSSGQFIQEKITTQAYAIFTHIGYYNHYKMISGDFFFSLVEKVLFTSTHFGCLYERRGDTSGCW